MKPIPGVSDIAAQALLTARNRQASTLAMFRPTEQQEEFFLAMERDFILEMLLGGGNRSGKSVSAAVALSAFALNKPVTFRDGTQHHMRPERWRNEGLKIWIVGFDWKHIGKSIFRLLFEPDLFRIIRDAKTGKWRAWNPYDPLEAKMKHLTSKAPPLIRHTEIIGGEDGISWENKKEKQISRCELNHDGTSLQFFPSTGARPQGDPAHLIWVDEAIEDGSWYSELLIRLTDHDGRLMWTAWPDMAPSAEMSALEERAKEQLTKERRTAFHIVLKGSNNPYTQGELRGDIIATMDEDEAAARDGGAMNKNRWRIYPHFDKYVHRLLGRDPANDDAIAREVRLHGGIPGTWTRYLILDPGTINPAVLMVAVPPPSLGDFIVPYDEIYVSNTWAQPLAQMIAARTKGTYFEDFIIDSHAARQTPMGFDGRIGDNYEKEFAKANLRCRRRGSRFSFGSDNVATRINGVRGVMNIRENGTTRLRIHGCEKLVEQLISYRRKADAKKNPMEEPAERQKIDVAQCLEYFVSRDDLVFVPPPVTREDDKHSKAAMVKSINLLLGKTSEKQTANRSVYCGAGSVTETPFM